MAIATDSPVTTQFQTVDGLSIRFAESVPRDQHALLLSPWPESLLAFEQMGTNRLTRCPAPHRPAPEGES